MAPPGVSDTRGEKRPDRTAYERAGCGTYRIPPSGACVYLSYVCTRGAVSGCCLRVLSQRLALQVCDRLISAHVFISHELLDAVGVHVHVFLAAEGTNLGANTVGDFTLNAVAQV